MTHAKNGLVLRHAGRATKHMGLIFFCPAFFAACAAVYNNERAFSEARRLGLGLPVLGRRGFEARNYIFPVRR
jgi:hypothetical protein